MDQAEELRYLFLAVQREGNRALTDALAPLDLTPAQAEVLQVLEQYGSLTLVELGERLVCENGSPSRLVNSMVDKGLVQKTTSETDRRASQLTLSQRSRDLMPALNEIEGRFNQSLDFLDTATMDQALGLLWMLAENTTSGQALKRRKNRT
jgi:DNA-binding MarR family transcriptional regulator